MAVGQAMVSSIASEAFAVTPHDTNANNYSYLYVGTSGDVAVVTAGGNTVTFTGVLGGSVLWIQTSKVLSTGTNATNIVGMR